MSRHHVFVLTNQILLTDTAYFAESADFC